VIQGCIDAGKPENLTVILPQSLSKQPADMADLIRRVRPLPASCLPSPFSLSVCLGVCWGGGGEGGREGERESARERGRGGPGEGASQLIDMKKGRGTPFQGSFCEIEAPPDHIQDGHDMQQAWDSGDGGAP
jgi:hypothetical protein